MFSALLRHITLVKLKGHSPWTTCCFPSTSSSTTLYTTVYTDWVVAAVSRQLVEIQSHGLNSLFFGQQQLNQATLLFEY